jgi:signal peptidase I
VLDDLSWSLSITDEDKNAISMNAEILMEFPISDENSNGGRLNAHINNTPVAVMLQDDVAYVRISETGTISFRPYYSVSVSTDGNGDMIVASEKAEEGSSVKLITHLEQGWELASLTISVNGGEAVSLELTGDTFVMPQGDVVIHAVFAEADYEVIFMANGMEISRKTYRYGDIVEIPDMTENLIVTKDKSTFTFSGWDSEISAVKGDIVYTAVYTEGDASDDFDSDYRGNVLFNVILPIFAGLFTLGIAAVIFLVIRKKKYGKGIKGLGGDISRWSKSAWSAIKKTTLLVACKMKDLGKTIIRMGKSAWAAIKKICSSRKK